jgi:hypothetical protein
MITSIDLKMTNSFYLIVRVWEGEEGVSLTFLGASPETLPPKRKKTPRSFYTPSQLKGGIKLSLAVPKSCVKPFFRPSFSA